MILYLLERVYRMSSNPHIDFLKLLGWEGEELEKFLPQWLHAADYLGLKDEDVSNAIESWLPTYWDMSLLSVRKLIAACIREAVELSKAEQFKREGKKIIYSNPTASHASLYANKVAGGDRLHVFYPDFIITSVNQAFFGKTQSGSDGHHSMSANCQHCALNCIRLQACFAGQIIPPTVTWNWGLHCNEASKTEEMIHCLYGEEWQDVFIMIPHDAPNGSIEAEDEKRVSYFAQQIKEGQRQVSAITGIEVTEEHMRQATEKYLAYMRRMEKLSDLVINADPQPMAVNELTQFGICMQVCFDTGLDYINDAIDTAIEEMEERIKNGIGILPKGAPKLACHFQPLNIPWIDRAFLKHGVAIALGRIFPPASWLEEAVDESDMYITAARHCLLCPNAVNMKNESAIATRLLSNYNFDGALFGFFSHDRWIGALHKTMIREVEEITGIPHYYLEGEFWSDDNYSMEDRLPIIRSICNSLKISKI